MAGAGWRQWTRERLSQTLLQTFLQDQVVMRFASASARAAQLTAPTEGMVSYLDDVNRLDAYDGSAWWPTGYAQLMEQTDTVAATADANGTYTFGHLLGIIPKVQLTLTSSPVQNVAKLCVGAKSTTQVQVVQYNSTNGAVIGNNPMYFDWLVKR